MSKRSSYLELVLSFTKRDLKARYGGTILGFFWIFFYPLSMTLIATLVFSIAFQKTIKGVPYFLFTLVGLISWWFFAQTVLYSTRSLIWNRQLVANTNFPKDAFILATSLSKLIDFVLNFLAFLFFFLIKGFSLPPISLATFLVLLLTQILFQTGVSFITSALNVYWRDVQNIVEIFLHILFYLTPVIYPPEVVPKKFKFLFLLNPLSHLIVLYRQVLFQKTLGLTQLIPIFLTSFSFFFLGFRIFKRLEKKFADVI